MSENIESRGQSGGITAHTVNISGAMSAPPEKPTPRWKKIALWIGGAVGFSASLVAVLEYVDLKPQLTAKVEKKEEPKKEESKPMSQQPQNINVTSYNQSGGITAHTVNVGAQPRTVTPQVEQELMRVVSGSKKVRVTCVMGDGEGFQFATAIKNFLITKGLTVDGVDQAVYTQPVVGQHANRNGDVIELIIGTKQ